MTVLDSYCPSLAAEGVIKDAIETHEQPKRPAAVQFYFVEPDGTRNEPEVIDV